MRTPLLRTIRSLVRDAKISRETGIPADEHRAMRAELKRQRKEAGHSRRRFLAGAGAAAALLAVPKFARAGKSQPSVTIVGGGIAGLTCALKLRDKGYSSTVYEASQRIGGRMHSNNTGYWAQNQVSEWCGELIDTGHTTVQNLADRYGLDLDDLHAAEPGGSTDTYYFDGKYYKKSDADADFLAIYDTISDDADAADYPTTFDTSTAAGRALDHMSVRQYINSRVPGGINSKLGQLLDVAYNIEYGADTTVQSSLNLLYLLAFQPTDPVSQLDVFGESDETYHIRGGNAKLPEAIADDIGDQIEMGHRLTKVKKTAGGRYVCSFDKDCGSVDITSDFVVLAIPFAVLSGVDTSQAGFDTLKNRAIQNLGRGHNGKLQLQFNSRIWNQTGAWPGKSTGSTYSDTGYQASWDVTRAQAGSKGIQVMYSGGSVTDSMKSTVPYGDASNSKVVQDANTGLAQLKKVYPGLDWNGRATQSLPHKDPNLNASYSFWKVGQYTDFGGYEGATQGGVYFCGEHTSQDFQGFMEGGASTGKATAKDLAKVLK